MLNQINVSQIRRVFDDGFCALDGVSLEVPAGTITTLVGPSGCGKTTLLRIIGGLDSQTSGSIQFQDSSLNFKAASSSVAMPASQPNLSFAFQEPRLLPWRSVLANVALPLELAGVARSEREDRAQTLLTGVQLGSAGSKLPGQLSGGMRMRVAIARALVTEPQILLLDEPFGALDEITRFALDELLLDLWRQRKMTVLMVTHSITEAAYISEQVVVMAPAPGRVVARICPAFRDRDASLRTRPEFAAVCAQLLQCLGNAVVESEAKS